MENFTRKVLLEIREALNMTQVQLADALRVNVSRIKGLESGRLENLTRDENKILTTELNISPEWLITGEGNIFKPAFSLHEERENYVTSSRHFDFVQVPKYDVMGSAGNGKVVQSELIVDHLAFRADWIHNMGLNKNQLALISVDGDSMEPTLQNRDLVLIDTRISGNFLNGVYAIQHKGCLLIKRIQSKLNGTIVIRSDNSKYESEILAEADKDNFIVVGRVVWFAREM